MGALGEVRRAVEIAQRRPLLSGTLGGGESPEILDGGMEASGRKWANDEDGVRREKGEVKS